MRERNTATAADGGGANSTRPRHKKPTAAATAAAPPPAAKGPAARSKIPTAAATIVQLQSPPAPPQQQQPSPPTHSRLGSVSSPQTPPSMHSLQEEEDEERHQATGAADSNGSAPSDRMSKVTSISSIDTLDQVEEAYLSDCPSDDIDKLSMCLSEASSEDVDKKTSLFSDLVQAQLALWTLIFSIFYSYAWQQHRKKFLFSLFVMVPMITVVCCSLSSLLTVTVVLGRLFSTPLRIQDIFKLGAHPEEDDKTRPPNAGKRSVIRRRSTSGNSCASTLSGRSASCEELPKPVCRKHSTSNGSSLNLLCGTPVMYSSFNGGLNGFGTSAGGNGFRPSGVGLNGGRSGSVCGSPKYSYQHSHAFADCSKEQSANGNGRAAER